MRSVCASSWPLAVPGRNEFSMHLRFSLWAALFVFVAASVGWMQTPATPASAAPSTQTSMEPGQIVVKKVVGAVSMKLNGATTELHNDDPVSQSATVITGNDSSVILVFSNGATTQLGADTSLSVDEFMQDPFKESVAVGNLQAEPTKSSHTKLHLTKGELVGQVAKLHHDQGSYFTVETPVGAAGIRGTTFRIVFRPGGTGQAFVFALSTVEGNVGFHQGATGDQVARGEFQGQGQGQGGGPTQGAGQGEGQGGGQGQGQGQTNSGTTSGGTTGGGTGGGTGGTTGGTGGTTGGTGGVAVTSGQEVVVTVTVNVNPQTGQVVITEPPRITSTVPISAETQRQIVAQAQVIATTAATTTFTATPPSITPTNAPTSGDQSTTQQQGDSSSGNSSGGTTSGSSSGGTTSGSSTGGTGGTGTSGTTGGDTTGGTTGGGTTGKFTPSSPTPPVTNIVNPLTPGAGQ
jgi:hypothetical protein